jgi:hypothetical protein
MYIAQYTHYKSWMYTYYKSLATTLGQHRRNGVTSLELAKIDISTRQFVFIFL